MQSVLIAHASASGIDNRLLLGNRRFRSCIGESLLDVFVTDNHNVTAVCRRTLSMGRLRLIRLLVSLDVKPKFTFYFL